LPPLPPAARNLPMRIALDGSALRPNRTGVGYYTEHLLRHLAQTAPVDDELIVISNGPVETAAPLPPRIQVLDDGRHIPRMVWMQTRVPGLLSAIGADVAHFTNAMMPLRASTPSVVTIHDMSLRLLPRFHPPRRVLLNRPLMDCAARRAGALITVSESARRDIVAHYRLDPNRVHVVYEAAAPQFRPIVDGAEIDRIRRKYQLSPRVILYVGTIEPRKNLPILIDAFARARRAGALDHQLVCVGPYGWLSRGIDDLIVRSKVGDAIVFTGYVPFEDLPALYSAAEIFVYPSMYEGFGLPVVEAMACGTPVITGRAAAVAEIGAHAVEHVDPMDADSLAAALASLASDGPRRAALSAAGLARSEQFSWTRAASHSLALYHAVAEQASSRQRSASATAADRPLRSPAGPATSTVDVLFGQAYFLRFDPKLWEARQPYAPLGALYAAACAREAGYRVALFDAMLAESEDEWTAALDRHRPRFAVIYEDNFNYLSKMCLLRMRQAALAMIGAARARGIAVIVSGSDASDHPATYLNAGADVVIAGEGEVTLVETLDALAGRPGDPGDELARVNGICRLNEAGHVVRAATRAIIRDLDTLPFPAWDLVDVERYRSIWRTHHGYYSMNVVTTRGCPYHCNWCAKPIYGQRYTARSADRVVDEIAWLKGTHAPDHLWIADDIFGLKPGWIERFAEQIVQRDAVVPFKCLLRADQVTADIAAALGRAGCHTAWIGAESGSQRVLDAMEKGTRVEQIHAATRLLRAAGVHVGFFLQFGYPGEDRDDIERTLDMVRACRPDDIGVSVSYPLPGTRFYQRVQAQLGQKQNWVDSNDLAMMYHATYVPDFYRALHAFVHTEFRARRSADEVRRALVHPLRARTRTARAGWQYLKGRAALPLLRRQLQQLSRIAPPQPPVVPLAVLSPQAAAVPTEQPR
jgi:anaerobic magnesium-protoporphyrin IX monomethyl ester cyclase